MPSDHAVTHHYIAVDEVTDAWVDSDDVSALE
jgi:hypothetical protein